MKKSLLFIGNVLFVMAIMFVTFFVIAVFH